MDCDFTEQHTQIYILAVGLIEYNLFDSIEQESYLPDSADPARSICKPRSYSISLQSTHPHVLLILTSKNPTVILVSVKVLFDSMNRIRPFFHHFLGAPRVWFA